MSEYFRPIQTRLIINEFSGLFFASFERIDRLVKRFMRGHRPMSELSARGLVIYIRPTYDVVRS